MYVAFAEENRHSKNAHFLRETRVLRLKRYSCGYKKNDSFSILLDFNSIEL